MPGQFSFYVEGGLYDIYFNFGTGSVTSIKNQSISSEVSVKDFGAIGGGVTDDSAAFQSAFDVIKANNGSVYIPEGSYLISNRVKSAFSNCTVYGDGHASQIISNLSAIDITAITKANPAQVTANAHGLSNGEQVYIKDVGGMVEITNGFYIVASSTTNTFELSGINSTAFTTYTSGGTGHMPCISISDDVSALRNNTFRDFSITGVLGTSKESALLHFDTGLERECRRLWVEKGNVHGVLSTGCQNPNNFNLTIRDCVVDGYHQTPSIDGGTNGTLHSFFAGTIKDNGNFGVYLSGGSSHTLMGCILEGNTEAGIKTVTDRNMISQCSFESNTNGHIVIGDSATNDRANFAFIEHNEFSSASVQFVEYSTCRFNNNILTSSCFVNWGSDESNKISYCNDNLMNVSLMTIGAAGDSLVVKDNVAGTTSDNQGELTTDSTTPSVLNFVSFTEAYTTPTNVTQFLQGYVGKQFSVIGSTGNITFVDGALLKTHTGSNITLAAGEIALFTGSSISGNNPIYVLTGVIS